MASMKENLAYKEITTPPKKLKLQFKEQVSMPVYTGKPLLGENGTAIKIALVDAITGQIVNTGPESMAKLEIVGFQVPGDDNNDDSWTFEDFQEKVMSEKKGKRTLKGNTSLQLKEGVCFIGNIHFTHTSEHNKKGWYKLGAGIVDAALMHGVEVARTEAFLMKDGRAIYSENHLHPRLSDKVSHLKHIRNKGPRYECLEKENVITVRDLLILFYTDQKRLKNILKLKAASKIWADIVNNAQASTGMFLYLDQSNEPKAGVVLNAKLELKAFIEESHRYIPVNQLSDKQKVDSQHLVKLAIKHLKTLKYFEDETSLKRSLQSSASILSLPSANRGLGTCKTTIRPPRPSSHETYSSPNLTESPNNLNSNMGHHTNRAPIVTPQPDKLKEKVPFDDVNLYSTNTAEHSFGTFTAHNSTEAGSSSQTVESHFDTSGLMNTYDIFNQRLEVMEDLQLLRSWFNLPLESLTNEWHANSVMYDADAVTMVTQTITIGPRWKKVSKLLRRNSVRERFGIQAHKRQRCF
ncbi:CALMODULIN-BINDING PROTEIN60 [Artemisia annua]|uniref:CALMODULIN-BINDING PROTEIN60 n=1 Tax=Artemisia annua TaxID=35608 RepID=A0A2U1KSH8_ARTAN|nr:CALMODULIN-BINDING PROTEIN60 [Artemisia annua]